MLRMVKMVFEKETKGAVRYAEEGEKDLMLVTLYVRKSALKGTPPRKIEVTLKSGEGE